MRLGSIAAAVLTSSVVFVSRTASADSMDPALKRLVHGADGVTAPCSAAGRYIPGSAPCVFDDAAFKRIIAQFGFAFAPLAIVQLPWRSKMCVTAVAPAPPRHCAMPQCAPSTCCGPAAPRSCSTTSAAW